MKRVLKWTIPVDDQRHEMGAGRVIHVECQGTPNTVQVWTEEVGKNVGTVEVQIYGTGHTYPDDGEAVGSTLIWVNETALVWHVVAFSSTRNENW